MNDPAPALAAVAPLHDAAADADLERRFGGLARLYGAAGYARLRAARVAVVGLGGVGSWTAEALARSGVARLVLIDLDHVAESNVNRQVQALTPTLGQAKVQALAERIALIHPACSVRGVEAFVEEADGAALLTVQAGDVDAIVDACDQVKAKALIAAWAHERGLPCVTVGAAGGKRRAERVEVAPLAAVTHDPLLAGMRQRLRQAGVMPRGGAASTRDAGAGARKGAGGGAGPLCVFSREPVALPQACEAPGDVEANLNCHGYGSSVAVTATFGMVAAGAAIEAVLGAAPRA